MRESKKRPKKNPHSIIGSLMQEPELQEFVGLKSAEEKLSYKVSDALRSAVNRFVMNTLRALVNPSVGSTLATTAHGLSLIIRRDGSPDCI